MTRLTHLEMTALFRKRMKAAGIKALINKIEYCGIKVIRVQVPKWEIRFTPAELKEMGVIAQVNGLTFARKSPIDLDNLVQMTGKETFMFEYHG